MENKLSFFQKFTTSLYNFKNYKNLLNENVGKSILYLLIISIIFSTFINVKIYSIFNKTINEVSSVFKNNLPTFNFENGELYIDEEMPIIIKEDNSTLIIDTSLEDSEVSDSLLDDYDSAILITKHTMLNKESDSKITKINLNNLFGVKFNNDSLNTVLGQIKIFSAIAIFGLCPLFSFAGKLLSTITIMSLFALILFSCFGKKFSYSKIINLSIYALTVPIILNCINKIFFNISYFFLLYYFAGFIYLFFAIKYLPKEDTYIEQF